MLPLGLRSSKDVINLPKNSIEMDEYLQQLRYYQGRHLPENTEEEIACEISRVKLKINLLKSNFAKNMDIPEA